jgi:hypothetical protein
MCKSYHYFSQIFTPPLRDLNFSISNDAIKMLNQLIQKGMEVFLAVVIFMYHFPVLLQYKLAFSSGFASTKHADVFIKLP